MSVDVTGSRQCMQGTRLQLFVRLALYTGLVLICQMTLVVICQMTPSAVAQPDEPPRRSQPQSVSHGQELTPRPVVIAHRGASGYLPEHTQESTVLAHAMGADYLEQDVVLTKDGVAIVLHDLTLDDVTDVAERFPGRARDDGRYYAIDFSWPEIQQLTVHERTTETRPWKDQNRRFPAGTGSFRIASLSQQLALIGGLNQTTGRNVGVYVEIKEPQRHREFGQDVTRVVLQILTRAGYDSSNDRIFLQCFDFEEVQRLRTEFQTELPIVQLCAECPTREQLAEFSKYADGVGLRIAHVIQEIDADGLPTISDVVAIAKEHALQVHVGTVRSDALPAGCSDPQILLTWLCREAGVDGVMTDHPDVVLRWRTENSESADRSGPFHLLNESGPRGRSN